LILAHFGKHAPPPPPILDVHAHFPFANQVRD
jgi:hypothetical protein